MRVMLVIQEMARRLRLRLREKRARGNAADDAVSAFSA